MTRADGRNLRRAAARTCALAAVAAAGLACDGEKPGKAPAGGARAPATGGFVESAVPSGLVFQMAFLPTEQGEKFKINLYDHGAGVAVGDVDGDGDDDVYLLNQLGKNGLFVNDGRGKFTDATAEAGVGLGDRICVAATFADADGDGDQDLYVTSTRGGNVYFRNDGKGIFVDATGEAGLELVRHSQSAAFFDCDGDADLDLFVTNTAGWTLDERDPGNRYFLGRLALFDLTDSPLERNVLYANDGKGRFTDVTAAAGVAGPGWGGDMAVLDYDDDGRIDLLVGSMFGETILYHNEGGGRFADVTKTALGRPSWGTIGVKPFDYDGDGRLDVMLADMHSDMWMEPGIATGDVDERRKYDGPEGPRFKEGRWSAAQREEYHDKLKLQPERVVFGNTLFRSLGGGRFEEVSDRAGVETLWPWGIATGDFDGDGSVDVYLPSGMGYPFPYWHSYLLMNRGDGTFEDRSKRSGIDPLPGGEFLPGMIGKNLAARSSRCAATADFDGDGRPDIVVNNFNDRAFLYRNEFPARSYVAFRLTGTRSNRDAIGAVVTLRAGGRVQVRQVDAACGYLAQSSKTLLFGMGDATKVDSCEIRWPSGQRQTVGDVRMNAVNAVTEPSAR